VEGDITHLLGITWPFSIMPDIHSDGCFPTINTSLHEVIRRCVVPS
jgi:hypothetical protein